MQADPSAKRSYKGTRRRLRFVLVLLLCFMGWAGVTVWDQFGKLYAKSSEVSELEQQLADAKKIKEETQREITRLHDPEYIEQKIRKDLNLSKPGETRFTTPKGQP